MTGKAGARARPAGARGARRTPIWRRWWVLALAVVVLAGAVVITVSLTGGSSTPTAAARPLTADEADRLAVTRFRNYQATGVSFSTTVPSEQGPLPLAGWLDFRRHLGYAATRLATAGKTETAVLQWNLGSALTWPGAGNGLSPPAALPPGAGTPHPLAASTSALNAVLLLLLNLGSDRPDNAQLLRQSGAAWLRSDTVRGTPVDVFQGPGAAAAAPTGGAVTTASSSRGNTRYYVDTEGKLLRFDAVLPAGLVTVELGATTFLAFPAAAALNQ